jgi:hypothetical protein
VAPALAAADRPSLARAMTLAVCVASSEHEITAVKVVVTASPRLGVSLRAPLRDAPCCSSSSTSLDFVS